MMMARRERLGVPILLSARDSREQMKFADVYGMGVKRPSDFTFFDYVISIVGILQKVQSFIQIHCRVEIP